jgi:hypothetical protein
MKPFRKHVAIAVDGGIKGGLESLRPLSSSLRPLKEMSQRHQCPSAGSAIHRSVAGWVPGSLLARIASTGHLIDLIVYRLYGLTEEEVVEGNL